MHGLQGLKKLPPPHVPLPLNNRTNGMLDAPQRNALRVMKMSASTDLYKPVKKGEPALKMRIKEIAAAHRHHGYRRMHVLLRREGHTDNVKRIYRLCREQGL